MQDLLFDAVIAVVALGVLPRVGWKVDQWRGELTAAVSIDLLDVQSVALGPHGARQAQSRLHRVLVSGHDRLVRDVGVACLERLRRRPLES